MLLPARIGARRLLATLTFFAVVLAGICSPAGYALADDGGFTGSDGESFTDESFTNWLDGLPNIMEIIQDTFFPSYGLGGGGGGHAFFDEDGNPSWHSVGNSTSSSSDSGQTQPSVGAGALVFSGNTKYIQASYLYGLSYGGEEYFINASRDVRMPEQLVVSVDKNMFDGVPEGQLAILLILVHDRVQFQVFSATGTTTSNNQYINNLPYVNSISFVKYSNLQTAYEPNNPNSSWSYTLVGGNLHIYRNEGSTNTIGWRSSNGTQSMQSNYLMYAQGSGGDDNPSGGGDNPSGGNDNPSGGGDEPTGGGGTGIHFGGDTYNNETNEYNNTTVINDADVDLSPITARLDAIKATLNQMGRDLEMLAVVIDQDLMEIYTVLVYQSYLLERSNGLLGQIYDLMDTLDKDTDNVNLSPLVQHLGYVETYLEGILSAITNLADEDTAFPTIRGDVRTILNRLDTLIDDVEGLGFEETDYTDLLVYRSGIEGERPLSVAELLHQIELDLVDLHQDMQDAWLEFRSWVHAWEDFTDDLLRAIEGLGTGGGGERVVHYPTQVHDPETGTPRWIVPYGPTGIEPTDDTLIPTIELNISMPFDGRWIADAADKLDDKFPFSAAPKVVELMGYLKRPASPPIFDLPVPNPSDWGNPHLLHVDLSNFDLVASTMRMAIMVWGISRVANRTVKMWARGD